MNGKNNEKCESIFTHSIWVEVSDKLEMQLS